MSKIIVANWKNHPENSEEGYSMSQEGFLRHYNLQTKMMSLIRPTETDVQDRYNWNSALAIDPFHTATIYYGSQVVHKSTDKGKTWAVISPDLTTNDSTKRRRSSATKEPCCLTCSPKASLKAI